METVEKGLSVVLTERCNLDCRYCLRRTSYRAGDFLDLERLKTILRLAAERGYTELVATGGEALLHPRFDEFVRAAACHPWRFVLETNGILLTERRLEELHASWSVERLQVLVSLDSNLESVHDRLRGEGAFRQAVDCIRRVKRRGLFLHINATITPVNLFDPQSLDAFLRFCRELGVDRVYFSRVVLVEHGQACGNFLLTPAQVSGQRELFAGRGDRGEWFLAPGFWTLTERPSCPVLELSGVCVTPHGLSPCLLMSDVVVGTHEEFASVIDRGVLPAFNRIRNMVLAGPETVGGGACSECSLRIREHLGLAHSVRILGTLRHEIGNPR